MNHGISEIKQKNIHAVMDALIREKTLTRGELARRCQLSLTTIGKIIDGLLDYGILSEQHVRIADSGRHPALFTFTDTAAFVLFHISDTIWSKEQIDYRLHTIHRVDWRPLPDIDPGEALRLFLLRCRDSLQLAHDRIKLCALLNESTIFETTLLEQAIQTHIGMQVTVTDSYASALTRAARHEGIIDEDRRTVGILDCGSFSRILFAPDGEWSLISEVLRNLPLHGEYLAQAMHLLNVTLAPDLLLVCTDQPTESFRQQIEAALTSRPPLRPVTVVVRNTDEFLTLGVGLAVQDSWLIRAIREEKHLR